MNAKRRLRSFMSLLYLNKAPRFFIVCFMVILFQLPVAGPVYALSQAQLNIFQQGIYYYDNQVCGNGSSSGSTTSSGSNVFILGDSITSLTASSYNSDFQAKGAQDTIDGSYSRGADQPGVPSEGPATIPATGSMTGMQAITADSNQIAAANSTD